MDPILRALEEGDNPEKDPEPDYISEADSKIPPSVPSPDEEVLSAPQMTESIVDSQIFARPQRNRKPRTYNFHIYGDCE